MSRIFVTRKIPLWDEIAKPLYAAGHEVRVYGQNKKISEEELKNEISNGYDGLITLLTEKITPQVLEADTKKQLKGIANYAVGYDNINVEACNARGIKVTNTPCDEVNESVAEFTWTMLLALSRRLTEATDFMRNAAYRGWEPDIFVGNDTMGKTLGIVGMGRIGGMVSRRAAGFGMKVIYYNRKRLEAEAEAKMGSEYRATVEEILQEADAVSLHVPLGPETLHLINKKNLPLFKKGAILINTARGPVVDEAEVVEALRAGMLAGYAADVFENEPDPHPELLQMENVILSPHIASATWGARKKMGELAVANITAILAGEIPANLVKV